MACHMLGNTIKGEKKITVSQKKAKNCQSWEKLVCSIFSSYAVVVIIILPFLSVQFSGIKCIQPSQPSIRTLFSPSQTATVPLNC